MKTTGERPTDQKIKTQTPNHYNPKPSDISSFCKWQKLLCVSQESKRNHQLQKPSNIYNATMHKTPHSLNSYQIPLLPL
jgi:hypothetical protein